MSAEKIREADSTELVRQVQDTQEQLFRLRFQMGMGQLEGVKKYRLLRKERARVLTVLSERRHKGEVVPEVAAAPAPVKKIDKKSEKQSKKKK